MIRATDRLSTVLSSDPSLRPLLVELSPAFRRLESGRLGTVMSRLVTVAQAAGMAGMAPDELVRRLNGGAPATPTSQDEEDPVDESIVASEPFGGAVGARIRPPMLAAMAEHDVVTIDVREDLRAGKEPFSLIMAARRQVPEGGALCVRAIFEPMPLYRVMEKQGLAHWTEELGEEDWRVWFYPDDDAAADAPGATAVRQQAPDPASTDEDDVVILDVRGLEPPEPMVRTLAALEDLPEGKTLVQLNVRVPQFLLPRLDERGFTWEVREQTPDLVRLFIRRVPGAGLPDLSPTQDADTMDTTERVLDVRIIPPREKHPTIFQTFEALAPGESFVLVNDHDPKPLRYQFAYEYEGRFGWRYLEEGPSVWRVEISRTEP